VERPGYLWAAEDFSLLRRIQRSIDSLPARRENVRLRNLEALKAIQKLTFTFSAPIVYALRPRGERKPFMHLKQAIAVFALVTGCAAAGAQQTSQVQLKIEAANRTLTVSAEERVTADPDLAILHIGFETKPSDAKAAYAAGAKTSNEIVAALKQAGIPETSIRSESQHLDRVYGDAHKFKLVQQWTVRTPPERAAEILDVAVAVGATESGEIEWAVQDAQTLEDQVLDHAAARARANAAVLAKGMGVHLGSLIYVTNEISAPEYRPRVVANNSMHAMELFHAADKAPAPPLAIEPHKVSRVATVYAVFAIE
jgi:hypothetical protein